MLCTKQTAQLIVGAGKMSDLKAIAPALVRRDTWDHHSQSEVLLGGQLFNNRSNIDGIDRGRAALARDDIAPLVADAGRETEAVKALRDEVPSLSLLDAVRLVREARPTAT